LAQDIQPKERIGKELYFNLVGEGRNNSTQNNNKKNLPIGGVRANPLSRHRICWQFDENNMKMNSKK
jgi:hypothetical protein